MSFKICVLGSSSGGNSTFLGSETTRMLVDAGLSAREIARRLEAIGERLESIRAICVTHEHDDHKAALGTLHRRHGIGVYANSGTQSAIEQAAKPPGIAWNVFTNGAAFEIGDLRVEPFSVPHDAYDPVGFVVSCGRLRVGVVTDMGMPTTLIRERLKHCHALVLESNHDEKSLQDARRPWSLKQRIAGRQGHLSNAQAAELIKDIAGPELKAVFLAHLSSDCNTPALALASARTALDAIARQDVAVHLSHPDRPSELVLIEG